MGEKDSGLHMPTEKGARTAMSREATFYYDTGEGRLGLSTGATPAVLVRESTGVE